MNFGKAFNYPFEDDRWLTKSLIGALVTAIPIVNFAWGGYLIDLLKNVISGNPRPLPEWSDFGDKWVKGFLVFLASLIYAIPALILMCIPLVLLGGAAQLQGGDLQENAVGLFAGVGGLFGCLAALYGLFLSYVYPSVYIHYSRIGTFGAFFEFGNIIKIATKDTGKYITAWLLSLVAGLVVGGVVFLLSILIGWIPCIGWIIVWVVSAVAGVYVFYVYAHLFGQYAAEPGSSITVPPAGDITQ
jgi:hypothetical protein